MTEKALNSYSEDKEIYTVIDLNNGKKLFSSNNKQACKEYRNKNANKKIEEITLKNNKTIEQPRYSLKISKGKDHPLFNKDDKDDKDYEII